MSSVIFREDGGAKINEIEEADILVGVPSYNNARTIGHVVKAVQAGFEWISCSNWEKSIISFLRKGQSAKDTMLIVCNLTPVPRSNYREGVPSGGYWKEVLNSYASEYRGSGHGNLGDVEATPVPLHGKHYSLSLTLPPLGILFFKREDQ